MALLDSTYSALVSALGSSSSADDILQYINYLNLTNQQVDPGNTANVGIPGSTGYILGIPGASISVEQIDVELVPTAASTNKTAYSTTIGSGLSGSYNIGTAAGGAAGTDIGGATNLSLNLNNSGSGQRALIANLSAQSTNAGTGAVGVMRNAKFQANTSSGSSTTNLSALNAEANIASGSTVTNLASLESSANIAGTVTNYVGVNITASGAGTVSSAKALNIDLSGLSGVTLGSGVGLYISSGRFLTTGDFATSSGLNETSYNQLGSALHVSANTTGTTMVTNNYGCSLIFDANKTMVSGASPFPLSVMSFTSGSRVRMLAGSSIDHYVSNGAGIQIDASSAGGAMTNMSSYVAGIARNLSTNIAITNAYGFRVLNNSNFRLSGTGVTNAWGVYIEDTGAKNLFAGQVQIGDGTAGAPGIAFASEANSGLYLSSAGNVDIARGGLSVARFTVSGTQRLTIGAGNTGSVDFYMSGNANAINLQGGGGTLTLNAPGGGFDFFATGVNTMTIGSTVVFVNKPVKWLQSLVASASGAQLAISGYDVGGVGGRRSLSIGTEEAVVTEAVVSDRTLAVTINGTTYKLCLKA